MKDIIDTAVAAGTFNTLATALAEAGLIDTLKGAGPFTVPASVVTTLHEATTLEGSTVKIAVVEWRDPRH